MNRSVCDNVPHCQQSKEKVDTTCFRKPLLALNGDKVHTKAKAIAHACPDPVIAKDSI
jgi:hypothetical protein